jgi:geranylgeranyl diphosphate synthase type II
MSFKEQLNNKIERVENALATVYEESTGEIYQNLINESMRYSLLSGGKRLRPLILVEVAEILGGDMNTALNLACALEMIHTYSLIHDDLPAMDDDDIRRGKASNHVKYGEDIGILAGDGLLNGAYELMFRKVLMKVPTRENVMACGAIANAAGSKGMILGQVADIKAEDRSRETLDYINKNKTGALLTAAFVAGGYIAHSDKIETLSKIGDSLGKAFQIQDDVLDVIGDELLLGKPIGSDQKNDKATYVSLLGIERAKEAYMNCYASCIEELSQIPNSEFLMELVRYLMNRTH